MTEDESTGLFVYCTQHLRVHSTGWCTVQNRDKLPLEGKDIAEANVEAKEKGYVLPDGKGAIFDFVNGKLVRREYDEDEALGRIRKLALP